MHQQIIILYCLCDDYLKQKGHRDDPQTKMTAAEVLTTALVAAWFFACNLRLACAFLKENRFIPAMRGESRFNRHWQRTENSHWQEMLTLL